MDWWAGGCGWITTCIAFVEVLLVRLFFIAGSHIEWLTVKLTRSRPDGPADQTEAVGCRHALRGLVLRTR